MTIEKYKKLTEVEHVISRPGRYIGSINQESHKKWYVDDLKVKEKIFKFTPAFHKLFDEIISNSADHARTPEGKHLNKIEVTVTDDTITVLDNGGIPVVIHPEYNQYIPDMIFGELRSGSNFDDDEDSLSTGQNGEGSSLVNIFSKSFIVETALDGKKFKIEYLNNMSEKSEPEISTSKTSYTKITYVPDIERMGMTTISEDDKILIERRVHEIAFTNPKLKVYYNKKKCDIDSFEKFVKTYDKDSVYYEIDRWRLGVAYSKDGFKHISYVNSTPSFDGGTHVDYVVDKIVEAVREKIEKKTKQSIRPSEIKNNLVIMLDCNINNPRYNSQTKEKLITQPSQFGSRFDLDEKFIKRLLASKVVENIIEWAMKKKDMDDLKDIEQRENAVRKSGFYDIPKYRPATSKKRDDCLLFLAEGDCLDENTLVHTFDGDKELKDVQVGDLVLTHKNRYKKVTNKSYSVKSSIVIKISDDEEIIVSENHKLLVYVPELKSFGYVKAKDITKDMKLIKDRISTQFNKFMSIKSLNNIDDEKYDYEIIFKSIDSESLVKQLCTKNHSYTVYNILTKEYNMKKITDIDAKNEFVIHS